MSPIEVTIIVATSGPSAAVEDAVSAALGQTETSPHVVLVGPAPHSLDRQPSDRVVVLPAGPSITQSEAWNLGLRTARTPWVAFLAERDLWAPDHLRTLAAACEADHADFAYSASWAIDEQRRLRFFRAVPPPSDLARELLTRDAIGTPSSVLARRELLDRSGGFDEWLTALAPWDLWIRWSRMAQGAMVSAATAAGTQSDGDAGVAKRELKELRRRYDGDAKDAGLRFGQGVGSEPSGPAPGPEVRPPWLVPRRGVGRRST